MPRVGAFNRVKIDDHLEQKMMEKLNIGRNAAHPKRERARVIQRLARAQQWFVSGDWPEAEHLKEKAAVELELSALGPVPEINLGQATQLLSILGKVLQRATESEKAILLQTVLDEVDTRNQEIVAIRLWPDCYDLLKMSQADPTAVETAGDIYIVAPTEEFCDWRFT